MADQKRDVVDDVLEGIRRLVEDMDRLLRPEKHQKPVPVPVPVRTRPDPRDPRYRQ